MDQVIAKVSDLKTLWILVLGQGAVIIALVLRKIIEYKADRAKADMDDERTAKQRQVTVLDDVMKKLLDIEPMVRSTKSELDLFRPYIMGIPKLQDDLGKAFKWLKEVKPSDIPDPK